MGGPWLVSNPLDKWSQGSTTKGSYYKVKAQEWYTPNQAPINNHFLLSVNAENDLWLPG